MSTAPYLQNDFMTALFDAILGSQKSAIPDSSALLAPNQQTPSFEPPVWEGSGDAPTVLSTERAPAEASAATLPTFEPPEWIGEGPAPEVLYTERAPAEATQGGAATDSQEAPSGEGLLEPSYQGPSAEPETGQPAEVSAAKPEADDDIYKQITSRLLADLDNDKIDWGRAMSLMALAWKNPEAAHGLLEQDRQRKQGTKAMLLDAARQESANKRAAQSALDVYERQDKRAKDSARAQIEADARDLEIPVDLQGLPWDTDFEKARATANSLINRGKAMGAMDKELRKLGVNTSKITKDPTPENFQAMQDLYETYGQDMQYGETLDKNLARLEEGLTPEAGKAMLSNFKTPEMQARYAPLIAAAVNKGTQTRQILGMRQAAYGSAQKAGANAATMLQARIDKINAEIQDISRGRTTADLKQIGALIEDSAALTDKVTRAFATSSVLGSASPDVAALYANQGLELQGKVAQLEDATAQLSAIASNRQKELNLSDPKATFDTLLNDMANQASPSGQKPILDAQGKPVFTSNTDVLNFVSDATKVTNPRWTAAVGELWQRYKNNLGDRANQGQFAEFLTGLSRNRAAGIDKAAGSFDFKGPFDLMEPADYTLQPQTILDTLGAKPAPATSPAPAP